MPKSTNLLLARGTESRAVAQITGSVDQVVVRLIPFGSEHVSIHREANGQLLKIYTMADKPPSTWDDSRVEVARAMGYQDPKKHGQYADHRPLVEPYLFALGDHVVGRRIEFAVLSEKPKYKKHATAAVLAHDPAMIHLYFRRDRADPSEPRLFEIETTLGWLYVAGEPAS
jgi:hypothetical protein